MGARSETHNVGVGNVGPVQATTASEVRTQAQILRALVCLRPESTLIVWVRFQAKDQGARVRLRSQGDRGWGQRVETKQAKVGV